MIDLSKFLKEDNGNYSSMRLSLLAGVLLIVPIFLIICIRFPQMKDMATHVFAFVTGLAGIKAAQKAAEENVVSSPNIVDPVDGEIAPLKFDPKDLDPTAFE